MKTYDIFLQEANDNKWILIQEYDIIKKSPECVADKFEIWVSPQSEMHIIQKWDNFVVIYKQI